MGLTHFPHGVFATPNVGAAERAAMFQGDNIFFVDGDLSGASSGSRGLNPDEAVSLPSEAVSKAVRGGIVYVRPRLTAASAQTYYVDNITLPVEKPNLQILGCGADIDNPYMGVDIKASVVTTAVMTVYGAGCLIEGVRLAGTGQTADSASVLTASINGTTTRAYGLTIRNSRFSNAKGHLVGGGCAINLYDAIHTKIEHCTFTDCLGGIAVQSVMAAINGLKIINCQFEGTVAGRDVDILIYGGGASKGLLIKGCDFNDGLPNHGVVNRFIQTASSITGMLADCNFAVSGSTVDSLIGTAGAAAVVPTTILIVRCFAEGTAEGIGIASR